MIDFIGSFFGSQTSIEDARFCDHEIRYMSLDGPRMRKLTDSPLVDPASEDEEYYDILNDGCIYCGCEQFLEGPSGGLCTNVKCDECGQKYNLMPFGERALAEVL